MATISKLLLMTLFLILANQQVHSQDAISFTYNSFPPSPLGLTYQGGTNVPSNSVFLRLTETNFLGFPESNKAGRVLYSQPIKFWESSPARQAAFETKISFRIKPSLLGAADGLAFFIAPVNTTVPSGGTGGNLGIFGSSGTTPHLFAVEFDTYANEYDPSYRHIGIDIESRKSRKHAEFDSGTGKVVNANIKYNPKTKTISVVASSVVDSGKVEAASLSYVFDLKTILPQEVRVGISSATGDYKVYLGTHDVISWSFTTSLVRTNVSYADNANIRKYADV